MRRMNTNPDNFSECVIVKPQIQQVFFFIFLTVLQKVSDVLKV